MTWFLSLARGGTSLAEVDARRALGNIKLLRLIWTALGVGLCFVACATRASEPMDKSTGRWDDPLLTTPPVLTLGSVLPGDSNPVSCTTWEEIGTVLGLAQAVDIALCLNPQVHSAWGGIKQQAAAFGEAKAAYWPTASFNAGRVNDHVNNPDAEFVSSTVNSNTLNASLNWRVWDFGGREANQLSAAALLDAALANHDAVIQKTLNMVIAAYFDAQTARATVQAKNTSQSIAQQTLETAQRREGLGAGSQTDTLQAATSQAKATLDLSRAQGDYRKALAVLIYTLGLPTATPVKLAEDVGDLAEVVSDDLAAWLEQAQNTHPAIMAARAQLAATQQKLVATRAEGGATVDLSANFYQNGRPNQTLSPTKTEETLVSLTLSIPLFEGFARTYKIRGAQAQVEQRQADLETAQQQALMDVVKTHSDAMAALQNLRASNALLNAAQMSLATVQRKFDRGAADILEILNTQAALADAQLERIRCQADWRSARLRLIASAGGLGRKELLH